MMARRLLAALALLLFAAVAAGPSAANSGGAAEPESVLLRLASELPDRPARAQLRALGLEPLRRIPRINVWVARPLDPAADATTVTQQLQGQAAVRWAEINGTVTGFDTLPNDPRYGEQWPLPLIGAPAAWDQARGMAAPIAIVDTGLDLDHADLQAKLWRNPGEVAGNGLDDDGNGYVDDVYGYDIRNDDATPQDDNGHGSHVASIAAASANNGVGVAGLAWETPLLPVKVLSNTNSGTYADLAEGIIYAADNGARIINLSVGYTSPSATVEAAVTYALAQGALLVAASGNAGGAVLYPARLPGVVAVAASDAADNVWSSSGSGPEVALAAPGVSVLGCDHTGSWVLKTGTSMATPHVAGAAALLWGLRPELTRAELRYLLRITAVDIGLPGPDQASGAGRLDVGAAVQAAARWQRHALPVIGAKGALPR